ncbi:site-specific integrase [Halobacillus shinanisalinarum]|uniref:Site-specific integrase n=1 Tax=Halobacillus shinanisalinarum TaxID=2932258 RepID=A0ABY4GUQ7_9BACI|nr:site-specific integrase [Halobacillus shinanisalinarum]UOQ91445.1 site-specific integrase [Halobacillus shinanisalinarum]
MTFQDVYDEWWAIHSKTVKPSTQTFVQSKIMKHIIPRFGKLKIRDITKGYCQRVINEIADQIKSANDIRIQANQVFKYAVKMDYIAQNPMEYTVVPKQEDEFLADQEEDRNFWIKEEINNFLSLAKEQLHIKDYVLFYLLVYTGMRKGELIALEWKDIDLDKNKISINKTMFFKNGKEVIQKAKKKTSMRTIHIDNVTANLLRKWRIQQKEWLFSVGMQPEVTNVVTRADMRPLRLAYPNDKLKGIIKRNNLPSITIHGFRHSHASLLFEAGATIKEVQDRLGHKDIQTTMNVYAHVTDSLKDKTADRFQKFMDSE